MALYVSGQQVALREVVLRDKPAAMLTVSPKGTVPVLCLSDGRVLEESMAVMQWALEKTDPEKWLPQTDTERQRTADLIERCDRDFKHHLDRFKYASRYQDVDPAEHRTAAGRFLSELDNVLAASRGLIADRITLADIAIFPFVRQFAGAAKGWFHETRFPNLVPWLDAHINAIYFKAVMKKYPQWHTGDDEPLFPERQD